MFYYSSDMPIVGQIVIGHLIPGKEEANCLYVRVPEYNNIEGIIPKSDLPKKRRTFNRVLALMKKEKIIPCVIKTAPKRDSEGKLWSLDLTLRNIDRDQKQIIIDRYENIARIMKLIKFLSEETQIECSNLTQGFWKKYIVELEADKIADAGNDSDAEPDSDSDDGSDSMQILTDLTDLYQKILGNHNFMIDTISSGYELTHEGEESIREVMRVYTNTKKSDCNIYFEFRVDDAEDPVEVLQNTFTNVMDKIPDIVIQYRGAPSYVAIVQDVGPEDVTDQITELSELFESFLSSMDPKPSYYLKFSHEKSIAKEPIYSFSYPREVKID